MGGSQYASYYESGQLSSSRCNCRINFGGEGKNGAKAHVVVDCQQLQTESIYEEILLRVMKDNSQNMVPQPAYLRKAFHALLNDDKLAKGHRIDAHSDACSSYVDADPITSLSWGCVGILVLHPAGKTAGRRHMIVQRDGDMSIMGGRFQKQYLPGVQTRHVCHLRPDMSCLCGGNDL